jgi:hypothetical protein
VLELEPELSILHLSSENLNGEENDTNSTRTRPEASASVKAKYPQTTPESRHGDTLCTCPSFVRNIKKCTSDPENSGKWEEKSGDITTTGKKGKKVYFP